ncbi:MAG: hypothetical protein JSW58_14530 [Candidatus Latescibacterota bacterium]|nr:MAG: hypothetical protein JSW58_14530 [Candidatus Latescibacterota bacterium]
MRDRWEDSKAMDLTMAVSPLLDTVIMRSNWHSQEFPIEEYQSRRMDCHLEFTKHDAEKKTMVTEVLGFHFDDTESLERWWYGPLRFSRSAKGGGAGAHQGNV